MGFAQARYWMSGITHSDTKGARFQQEIEPLFIKYQVDLYLCGHMHMYERIYPGERRLQSPLIFNEIIFFLSLFPDLYCSDQWGTYSNWECLHQSKCYCSGCASHRWFVLLLVNLNSGCFHWFLLHWTAASLVSSQEWQMGLWTYDFSQCNPLAVSIHASKRWIYSGLFLANQESVSNKIHQCVLLPD